MVTAQRVSRGFRRLGFFSAAAVFLIASVLLAVPAVEKANTASEKHQKLLCAHDYFGPGALKQSVLSKALLAGPFEDLTPIDNRQLSLKALGCSICRLTVTLNG
jgi:hypothetical protein